MIKEIKKELEKNHQGQEEFHQACLEIFEDVEDFYNDNKIYSEYSIAQRMIEPDRIISFRVCWENEKGGIEVHRAWRVQFNNAIGAYKGGIRFHPTVNESVLKFLGFEQCFKNALTGLPMGGAKGGSNFDPRARTKKDVRRFCQAFMQELYHYIGDEIDVPAGDINVGSREIAYMFGHYLKLTNKFEGSITGKSPLFGGSHGREEATGYGCVYFLNEMLKAHDNEIKGKKVIVSGAGNVAIHAAEKSLMEGAKVLSLSDSRGTIYFKDGMNQEQLEAIKTLKIENNGSLEEYNEGEFKKGAKPWDIEADIALPCATQNEVDEKDAKDLIKGGIKFIAEGANMPLTAEAQNLVIKQNLVYGPGKASNAGGVAVSGLERTQNAELRSWTPEKVDQELQEIMKSIHSQSIEFVDRKDGVVPYRKGSNIAAFKRLADVLVAYGTK